MKTSRLPKGINEIRRIDLLSRRETARYEARRSGKSYIQSKTTRKVFDKRFEDGFTHDQRPYPFASTRQNARYARQIEAGQLSMVGVTGPTAREMREARSFSALKSHLLSVR